jgi:four helix bundle protein
MSNEEFAEQFKQKTKGWAIEIINFLNILPPSPVMQTIRYQLIRSATSTAANYRAACRARSNAEFIAKISISLEEADESLFWLEMIEGCKIDESQTLHHLKEEAGHIIGILVKARKNTTK